MRLEKWAKSRHGFRVKDLFIFHNVEKRILNSLWFIYFNPKYLLLRSSSQIPFWTQTNLCLRRYRGFSKSSTVLDGGLLFAGIQLPLWAWFFSRRKDPAGTDLSQVAELILHTYVLWELTKESLAGGVKNQYLSICLNMRGLVLAVHGESEYSRRIRGINRFHWALRVFKN